MQKKYKLILASGSPRRKELLSYLDVPFEILVSQIEEVSTKPTPEDVALDLAWQKAQAVLSILKIKYQGMNPLIIAADTIVVLGQEILGKPKDQEDAEKMLKKLSGKTHQVITAVTLLSLDKEYSFKVKSEVTFATIDEDLLYRYLKTNDPLDKAGAYGIQGEALTFIERVEGSYSNVVGFPLSHFVQELKSFLEVSKFYKGEWRDCIDFKTS